MDNKKEINRELFDCEALFHMRKIRYNILLDELRNIPGFIRYNKDKSDMVNHVNFFLDLNGIINSLYSPKIMDSIKNIMNQDYLMIAANILNIIAHYRNFFATRFGITSSFVTYYSTNRPHYITDTYPKFMESYFNKFIETDDITLNFMKKLMNKNFKALNIVSKYIPELYVLNTKYIPSFIIPFISLKRLQSVENQCNIIFKKENTILPYLQYDNTVILTGRNSNCKVLTKTNFNKILYKKKASLVTSKLLNIVTALIGSKEGIPSIKRKSVNSAINLLDKLIKEGKLNNTRTYHNENKIAEILELESDVKEAFISNFKHTNFESLINSFQIAEIESLFLDTEKLDDPEGLKRINSLYFSKHPLFLEELFIGY